MIQRNAEGTQPQSHQLPKAHKNIPNATSKLKKSLYISNRTGILRTEPHSYLRAKNWTWKCSKEKKKDLNDLFIVGIEYVD